MRSLFNSKGIKIKGSHKSSVLRTFQNEVLKNHVVSLPGVDDVLNLGAIQADSDKEGSRYSDYFSSKNYYTLDKNRTEEHPRHYVKDLHELSETERTFDLVLCMSLLEHVENPFLVAQNIKNIISENGYLFISSPFFYPIHKDKNGKFGDYWRFTDDGLRTLFSGLEEVFFYESPSVIKMVSDRVTYWDDEKNTVAGYCALFQNRK